jgi:hypothetical protein
MSSARPLLPQQENRAFEILRSADLDPNEFKWELVLSPWDDESHVSQISFPRLGLWFLFIVDSDGSYRPTAYPALGGETYPASISLPLSCLAGATLPR